MSTHDIQHTQLDLMHFYPQIESNTKGVPVCGVYLHGKLEDEAGYDCVSLECGQKVVAGVNRCTVDGHDGECVACIWLDDRFPAASTDEYHSGYRGLIVSMDDFEAEVHAINMYLKQPLII